MREREERLLVLHNTKDVGRYFQFDRSQMTPSNGCSGISSLDCNGDASSSHILQMAS